MANLSYLEMSKRPIRHHTKRMNYLPLTILDADFQAVLLVVEHSDIRAALDEQIYALQLAVPCR